MLEPVVNMFRIPELRRKLLITFGLLIAYRFGFHLVIPGVDLTALSEFEERTRSGVLGGILVFMSFLTGGGVGSCALFSLGIMPYISSSIIFSLLVKVFPKLEAIQKEGPAGQRKINEWTRYATVPLCFIQAWFVLNLFHQPLDAAGTMYLVPLHEQTWLFNITTVLSLSCGTIILMWVGEMITEYGVGNGISLLIMAGIVDRMPETIRFMIASPGEAALPYYTKMFFLVVLYIVMIIAIVAITQGQRRIPIQQARHTRGNRVYGGQRHFLPVRVNQAGVMPIIFASSLLMFPQMILSLSPVLEPYANYFSGGSFWYVVGEISLIVFFSFFWVGLMFQPEEMSNNMKEYGSFIPGIRPGRNTSLFLEGVMNRITFAGGFILALIAIGPTLTIALLGLTGMQARFAYFLGGTGILIVVGVVLDLVQKIESYLLMRHYEGFMKKGRIRGRR